MEYTVKQVFTPMRGIVHLIELWYDITGASEDGLARTVSIHLPGVSTERKEAWLPAASLPTGKQTRLMEDNSPSPWLGTVRSWFAFTMCNNQVNLVGLYNNGEVHPFASLAEVRVS